MVRNIALALVAVALVVYAVMQISSATEAGPTSANGRILKDVDTGELVSIVIKPGLGSYPLENPGSGKRTLYPTELCLAGPCADSGGTRVILNSMLGKEGPTKCPKCGADVRLFNRNKGPADGA